MPRITPGRVSWVSGLALRVAPGLVAQLGQAEVQDLHVAVAGDEDVLGLHVAVDDAALVRRGEPARDLDRVLDGLAWREPAGADLPPQRVALEQLRDDVGNPLVRAHVVDGEHVRVIERAYGLRFLLEAAQALRVGRCRLGEDLDGDFSPEPRVPGAVDLAHAAGPERPADLVGAETIPRLQRHGSGSQCANYRAAPPPQSTRQPGSTSKRTASSRGRSRSSAYLVSGVLD